MEWNKPWPKPSKTEINAGTFRQVRATQFRLFDLWEKAVIRGRQEDSDIVMNWFQQMLDFTDTITEDTEYTDYPQLPEVLKRYL